jgi:hypothetical protein
MIKNGEHWTHWIPETLEDFHYAFGCLASADMGGALRNPGPKYRKLASAFGMHVIKQVPESYKTKTFGDILEGY